MGVIGPPGELVKIGPAPDRPLPLVLITVEKSASLMPARDTLEGGNTPVGGTETGPELSMVGNRASSSGVRERWATSLASSPWRSAAIMLATSGKRNTEFFAILRIIMATSGRGSAGFFKAGEAGSVVACCLMSVAASSPVNGVVPVQIS